MAKILNTRPSNIRHTKRIEDKIQVKLWVSKDRVFITIDEYQKCVEEIQQDSNGSLSFGSILVGIGILVLIGGYSMNTTVSSYGDEYHNIGLMHKRSSTIQLGGIALITGTIMCCLNKKQTNSGNSEKQ